MTGDRLGQDTASSHGIRDPDLLPALAGPGELLQALYTVSPNLAKPTARTVTMQIFSGLTVEGDHSAMVTRLDGGLRFAMAIAMHRCQAAPAEA